MLKFIKNQQKMTKKDIFFNIIMNYIFAIFPIYLQCKRLYACFSYAKA